MKLKIIFEFIMSKNLGVHSDNDLIKSFNFKITTDYTCIRKLFYYNATNIAVVHL